MKQRCRKISIRAKIILSVMGIMVIIFGLLGGSSVITMQMNLIELGGEQAMVAAQLAEDQIDVNALMKLKPGDEDSKAYNDIVEPLRELQKVSNVKYLYTLTTDGSTVYYGVDTDESDDRCDIGEVCEENYAELKSVFAGEMYVADEISSDEYGDIIMAYIPLKDANGNVVAVLASDYDASEIMTRMNGMMLNIAVLSAFGYVFTFIIVFFVAGMLTKGMKVANAKLYDLVHNEGDLTQKLVVKSGDEMEIMANNLNELLEYIRTIMLQISSNSISLNESCKKIADNLKVSSDGVTDVSATMEEMSAAVEETSVSFDQIHDRIGDVYEKIRIVSGKALEGDDLTQDIQVRAQQIYEEAAQIQKEASERTTVISELVNEKINQSKAVTEIQVLTQNILSISAQTNMLALNANIEAARAGEAGRGFAVVAGEIGKLASDSASAATKIQEVSATVIQAVEELADEAENMLRFMDEVTMEGYGKLLSTGKEYYEDAEKIHELMENFAEESETIEKIADSIRESVEAVTGAMEDSARGTLNVAETSTQLSVSLETIEHMAKANKGVADDLATEVRKFKLES